MALRILLGHGRNKINNHQNRPLCVDGSHKTGLRELRAAIQTELKYRELKHSCSMRLSKPFHLIFTFPIGEAQKLKSEKYWSGKLRFVVDKNGSRDASFHGQEAKTEKPDLSGDWTKVAEVFLKELEVNDGIMPEFKKPNPKRR